LLRENIVPILKMSDVEEAPVTTHETENKEQLNTKVPLVDRRKTNNLNNLIKARAVAAANRKARKDKLLSMQSDDSESDHEISDAVKRATKEGDTESESEESSEEEMKRKVIKATEKGRKKLRKNTPIPIEVYEEMEKIKQQLAKQKVKASASRRNKINKPVPTPSNKKKTRSKPVVQEDPANASEEEEDEEEEKLPLRKPKLVRQNAQVEHLYDKMDHLFKF
jgi:hypothetical protein